MEELDLVNESKGFIEYFPVQQVHQNNACSPCWQHWAASCLATWYPRSCGDVAPAVHIRAGFLGRPVQSTLISMCLDLEWFGIAASMLQLAKQAQLS